jgi:hypothetical protein
MRSDATWRHVAHSIERRLIWGCPTYELTGGPPGSVFALARCSVSIRHLRNRGPGFRIGPTKRPSVQERGSAWIVAVSYSLGNLVGVAGSPNLRRDHHFPVSLGLPWIAAAYGRWVQFYTAMAGRVRGYSRRGASAHNAQANRKRPRPTTAWHRLRPRRTRTTPSVICLLIRLA